MASAATQMNSVFWMNAAPGPVASPRPLKNRMNGTLPPMTPMASRPLARRRSRARASARPPMATRMARSTRPTIAFLSAVSAPGRRTLDGEPVREDRDAADERGPDREADAPAHRAGRSPEWCASVGVSGGAGGPGAPGGRNRRIDGFAGSHGPRGITRPTIVPSPTSTSSPGTRSGTVNEMARRRTPSSRRRPRRPRPRPPADGGTAHLRPRLPVPLRARIAAYRASGHRHRVGWHGRRPAGRRWRSSIGASRTRTSNHRDRRTCPRRAVRAGPRRGRRPGGSAAGGTSAVADPDRSPSSRSGSRTTRPGSTPATASTIRHAHQMAGRPGPRRRSSVVRRTRASSGSRRGRVGRSNARVAGHAVVAAIGVAAHDDPDASDPDRWLPSSEHLHAQVEEVRGAADARVVAADQLLDAVGRLVARQAQDARRERREVGLDRRLVLARRRHDLRAARRAALVELVGVEEQAARRLGRPGGGRAAWLPGPRGAVRRRVAVDDLDRLGRRRATSSTARATMLRYGIARDLVARGRSRRARLGRQRVQPVAGERQPRRRPEEVRQAVGAARLERVRPRDLLLVEGGPPVASARGRGRRSRRCGPRSSGTRRGGGGRRDARSRSEDRASRRPATSSTVCRARSERARRGRARRAASSSRAGTRREAADPDARPGGSAARRASSTRSGCRSA